MYVGCPSVRSTDGYETDQKAKNLRGLHELLQDRPRLRAVRRVFLSGKVIRRRGHFLSVSEKRVRVVYFGESGPE